MKDIKYYLRLLALPLLFLGIIISMLIVWQLFSLPDSKELSDLCRALFETYGLPVIFVSALLEGMLLIGSYFPGSFVIMLGIAFATSWSQAIGVLVVGSAALMMAHIFNYLAGKYGWYHVAARLGFKNQIDSSRDKLVKKGGWAIMGSYWSPSLGAYTDTAAGILRMNFKKFLTYSLLASLFWNGLVTIIVFSLGDQALEILESDSNNISISLGIILFWIIYLLIKDRRERISL